MHTGAADPWHEECEKKEGNIKNREKVREKNSE
jgi:hypothetical protein